MESGIVVLLRVQHPDQAVDARDQVLDDGTVVEGDGIHVGQVQERDPVDVSMRPSFVDPQVVERRGKRRVAILGNPGKREFRVRPGPTDPGDLIVGDGVEQTGLPAAGASDERQHQGRVCTRVALAKVGESFHRLRAELPGNEPGGTPHDELGGVECLLDVTHPRPPRSRTDRAARPQTT